MARDRIDEFEWDRPGVVIASILATILLPPVGLVVGTIMLLRGHRPEGLTLLACAVLMAYFWINGLYWHHFPKEFQDFFDQLPAYR